MRTKPSFVITSVIISFLTCYTLSRSHVNEYRANLTYRLQAYALPLPIEIVKALSGEFKGMVANYYLLEVASFLGSQQETTEADWRAVANLLERSSSLDPYFRQTYRFAQATLPWHEKFEQALTILERSKDHLPWDWQPGFFIGFNYHFFIGDNETASMKLMEASRVKDAPVALATLAARLASKAGQTRTAIEFLSAVLEKTDDEETRNVLNERILALKGVQEIQSAIDRFKVLFGRMPDKLDDLVDNSILSVIPTNPYGRPYSFKDGNAEF